MHARLTLAGVFVLLAVLLLPATPAQAVTFNDVGEGDWFATAVDQLSNSGVVNGFNDGSFRPYDTVTRAQFASMLARALNPPAASSEPFEDVYSADWFWGSVSSLYAAGLVSGTSPTTFSPASGVMRQQAATMVMKGVGYKLQTEPQEGVSLELTESEILSWLGGFKDRWFISDAHRASVALAYKYRVISGMSDDRFYPTFTLTRAQAAGILYSALYVPLTARPSYPPSVPGESSYPVLSIGSSGYLVTVLEQKLAALKYAVGDVDGKYTEATRDGVMAFQKVERLKRDGQAGEQVWARIGQARTPSLRLSAGGNRVEIDLSRQVLFLVKGGSLAKILPISSGRSGWSTPSGHYRIQRKIPVWHRSSLGLLYMPSYFYAGYAIHGSGSVPAYPASHGCVRVPVWATPELYYQLPIGTPVDLYY